MKIKNESTENVINPMNDIDYNKIQLKQKENDNFKIFYTLKIGIKSLQGVILRGKKLQ